MPNCGYCDSFILFGGASDRTGCYCNANCQQAGHLMLVSNEIPVDNLRELIGQVHQGNCPKCQGRGPVDVHRAHKVWSAFILTSWSSSPQLSCKSCATKRQLGALVFSGVLGWWGIPWGLIMAPTQIIRNIVEICGGPSSSAPSPLLEKFVRMQAASHLVASGAISTKAPSAPPPPLPGA